MSRMDPNSIRLQVASAKQQLEGLEQMGSVRDYNTLKVSLELLKAKKDNIDDPELRYRYKQLLDRTIEQLNQGQPSLNQALQTIRTLETLLLHSLTDTYG